MAFNIDRFRKEQVYRRSGPIAELRADLEQLGLFDSDVERLRKAWGQATLLCLAAVFVAGITQMMMAAGPEEDHLGVLALGALGLLLVGFGVCLVRYLGYRRLDLDNRRYTLAGQVIHRLRRDIGPTAPVKLSMDFRQVDLPEKKLGDRVTPSGWKAQDFADPWLTLQTRLLDGTHLSIGMVQRLQKRSRTRRSISGKYKTKFRKKGWAVIQIQLRVKAERYPDLALMEPEARKYLRLPEGVAVARLQLSEDRLLLSARLDENWAAGPVVQSAAPDAPKAVVMMLLSLYQVLNYSKHLHKQAKAS